MNKFSHHLNKAFQGIERIGSIAWVWVILAAALLTFSGIMWVQKQQDLLASHLIQEEAFLCQARLDLGQGYLHVTLGGQPESPFDQAQGLAFIGQSHATLEQAARLHSEFEGKQTFSSNKGDSLSELKHFTVLVKGFGVLSKGNHGKSPIDSTWATKLRIEFFALERQAERVQAQIQSLHLETEKRYETFQKTITCGSGILLAIICLSALIGELAHKRIEIQRREAEESLRGREATLRGILNATKESILQLSCDGNILIANETAATRLYVSAEELIGQNYLHILPDEVAAARQKILKEVVESGQPKNHEDRSKGYRLEHAFYPILNTADRVTSVVVFSRDVTKRKQAEEQLLESERKFKVMIDTLPLAIYASSGLDQKATYINPAFVRLFGYPPDEIPTVDQWYRLAYPEDTYRMQVMIEWQQRVNRAIQTKTSIMPMEVMVTCKDGTQKYVSWGYVATEDQNYAFGLDLTERKRAEEALRKSEKEFRALFEQAAVGVARIETSSGRFLTVNNRYCEIVGYSREELLSLTFQELTHAHDLAADLESMSRLCRQEIRNFTMEKRYIHKNGAIIWVNLSVSPLWEPEEPPSFHVAVVEDISERKRVEELLRTSEERFRLFMDNNPAVAWMKDDQGRHVYLNKTFETRLGIRLEDVTDKIDSELWQIEVAEEFRRNDLAVLNTNRPIEVVEKTINADGSPCYWLSTKYPFVDAEGNRFVAGFGIDITDRKHAEETLRQREEEFKALVENAPDVISLFDRDLRRIYVNAAVQENTGLDASAMIGIPLSEAGYPESFTLPLNAAIENVVATGCKQTVEVEYEGRGERLWFEIRCAPVFDVDGSVLRVMTIGRNITNRKSFEIELNKSYQEKISLLKEVHHRVKNNLQIVASLLSLQASRSTNGEVVGVLQDTRNRVRSMALLHEMLYRSSNLASVNFVSYIKELCGQLVMSYTPVGGKICMEYHIAKIGLSLEHAVPLGLIVSELVSNALKHGFPNGRNGKIMVGLQVSDNQTLTLSVEDDGVGLPQNLQVDITSTLGLKLVSGLTQQLGGQLAMKTSQGSGALFHVMVPIPEGTDLEEKP